METRKCSLPAASLGQKLISRAFFFIHGRQAGQQASWQPRHWNQIRGREASTCPTTQRHAIWLQMSQLSSIWLAMFLSRSRIGKSNDAVALQASDELILLPCHCGQLAASTLTALLRAGIPEVQVQRSISASDPRRLHGLASRPFHSACFMHSVDLLL